MRTRTKRCVGSAFIIRRLISLYTSPLDQDPDDLKQFRKLKRSAIRPNAQLISDLKAWVETKNNFTVFGAPYQADGQMMYLLSKFSWIKGIIRYVCVSMFVT